MLQTVDALLPRFPQLLCVDDIENEHFKTFTADSNNN